MCLEANSSPACAGVITWMHTFSPAKMWIAGLTRLGKPLAHLHTQFNRDLPWGEIDMDFMNLNQSAHGDREFGFIGARLRLPRKIVVGHWQDDGVLAKLNGWSRAACAFADAQQLKIARFGGMNMREVAVTGGDRVQAQIELGWSVNGYGVGDLVGRIADVSDAQVDALVAEYEHAYAVSPAVRAGGARHALLRDAARQEIGMRGFLDEGGFAAFTTTFEDLHGLKQNPGAGLSAADGRRLRFRRRGRLEDRRPRARDEGDVGRPARRRVVHGGLHVSPGERQRAGAGRAHAGGLPVNHDGQTFAGDSSPRHRRQERSVPAGVRRLTRAGRRRDAGRHGWPDAPHRERGRRRQGGATAGKLPVARAVWIPRPDFATSCEAWILAGGAHHTSFGLALTPEHLKDFVGMAGIEFIRIGAGTTIPALENELRWNDLAYKLRA